MSVTTAPSADGERRLHPWSWLFVLLQQLRQFLLPLLALAIFGSRSGRAELADYAVSLTIIVLLVAGSLLQYLTYRYRIGVDSLSIRSGVLARNRREIPFARIHNVVVHQSLLHRLFGVAELRLESAGGDKPEAQMRVLRLDQALALEQQVRQRVSAAPTPDAPAAAEPSPDVLLRLPGAELLRLGLISNRGMVVVAAAIGATYQLFPRRVVEDFVTQHSRQVAGYADGLHLGTGAMVLLSVGTVIAVLVVMRLLSIAMAVMQYHGFVLTQVQRRLTVERGLLSRVRTSAARRRIQAWTLREGPLHRLFGRRQLRVDIATGHSAATQDKALKELAPVATPDTCDGLIQQLLPTAAWPPVQWQPASRRGWWRLCLPGLLVSACLAAGFIHQFGGWGALPLAWMPVSLWIAHRQIRRMAYALDANTIAVRGGGWSRWWRLAELDKLQALQLTRSPLDRYFGTATLTVDTAGVVPGTPGIALRFLPVHDAQHLLEQLSGAVARRQLRW